MDQLVRKTRRTFNEPGHAHYVTFSCYQRLPLLSRDRVRRWVIDALRQTRDSDYQMRRILVGLKQPVAKSARRWLTEQGRDPWVERLTVTYPSRRVFRFWQPGGGFDHNVFRDRRVPAVVEYIHANPVRRALAQRPADWPWSSARFWEGWSDVPLRMDDPFA